ncbi:MULTISPECIES: DUF2933 domain-containing protein [unclassified Marinovum]
MDTKKAGQTGSDKLMKYGMWACCAVMLLPVGAYFVAGGALDGAGGLATFAPLALCVGAHLVMHRFMGKSCHGKAKEEPGNSKALDARPIATPAAE